jgi:hypothetical protein
MGGAKIILPSREQLEDFKVELFQYDVKHLRAAALMSLNQDLSPLAGLPEIEIALQKRYHGQVTLQNYHDADYLALWYVKQVTGGLAYLESLTSL